MSFIDLLAPLADPPASLEKRTALGSVNGGSLTFGQLGTQLRSVSRALTESGLAPGDRALFALRPSPEAVVLYLSVLRAGGTLVATDLGIGETSFAARVAALKPRFVLSEPILLAASRAAPLRALLRHLGVGIPGLAAIPNATFLTVGRWWPGTPRSLTFARLRDSGSRASSSGRAERCDDDEAFVVFTSGTTDDPKGVVHTHGSLGSMLEIVREHLDARPGDVVFARDLHLVVPALVSGASVVLPPFAPFDPARTLATLTRAGVTHVFGVPHHWHMLVDHCERTHQRLPARLRRVLLGAAPVHRPFLERLRDVLAPETRVSCIYGMTEMLPVATVSLEEKVDYRGPGDLVGRLFPSVTARTDESGELLLRGPNLFRGYLGRPGVDEHATGDLARLGEDGRLVLLGRRKDMLIRGDYNIYPELYEPILESIPGVRRCAIVGVYDESIADERVVLAVEPATGWDHSEFEERFRREIRDGVHRIDLCAQPDAIMVGPIPVSGRSDKVDKHTLRAMARKRLALAS